MVVQHGKVYPKPELAYNLHESISFHRNNKFEGEITKIEKLENAVLLEGFVIIHMLTPQMSVYLSKSL